VIGFAFLVAEVLFGAATARSLCSISNLLELWECGQRQVARGVGRAVVRALWPTAGSEPRVPPEPLRLPTGRHFHRAPRRCAEHMSADDGKETGCSNRRRRSAGSVPHWGTNVHRSNRRVAHYPFRQSMTGRAGASGVRLRPGGVLGVELDRCSTPLRGREPRARRCLGPASQDNMLRATIDGEALPAI